MNTSIIITAYNAERYIGRAVRSCIRQSIGNHEVIVVDDGSTDNTVSVLESFGEWIKLIKLGGNYGLPHAANVGIRASTGQMVMRVDADDYVHEDILKVGYLYLAMNKQYGAVAFDYLRVDDKEDIIERVSSKSVPIACGILFRKDLLVDIGLYDEQFRILEDEDLRYRFIEKHSIYNISLPLYRYRKHNDNMTNSTEIVKKYRELLNAKHRTNC